MIRRVAAACVAAAMLAACSGRSGIYHEVEPGQTIYRIARAYDVEIRDLMDQNGIEDPRTLRTGELLWIPGASRPIHVPPYVGNTPAGGPDLPPGKRFVRPVSGTVSSGFGTRGGRLHDGVDILAPEGTKVRAAAHGVVIYAGDGMKGYGNAVVIDHGEEVTTLYAHLREIRIQSGDAVAAGEPIGTVGTTGNATTPHLHFELRVGDQAVDPERYL